MRWASLALDGARLLMEMAWISVAGAIIAVLLGAQGSPVPLWLAIVVGTLGFAATRFLIPEDLPLSIARGLIAGVGIAVLYLGVTLLPGIGRDLTWPLRLSEGWLAARPVIAGGLLLGAFWWRGTRLGQEDASALSLAQSFRIGVGVVVIGAVAHVLLPVSLGATPAAFLFFGAGIAGFALSHITAMAPEESAGLRDWPRMASLTVGGIVLASIVLAIAAEGELGQVAATLFQLVMRVLTPIAVLIGWAIGLAVQVLTYAVLYLTSLVRGDEVVTFNPPPPPDFSNLGGDATASSNRFLSLVLRFLGWVAVLLAGTGIAVFLWRALGVRSRGRGRSPDEERERLESEGTLGDDLAAALGSILGRLAPRRSRRPSPMEGLDSNDPRRVALGAYHGLLALAEEQGLEREAWRTPQEFEGELGHVFPPDDVDLFTRAFVRARYGAISPTDEEVARLRSAWASLQEREPGETDERLAPPVPPETGVPRG